jgi:predicted transcriptional regulator
MKQEELDSILQVMENPVRRRILKRLSQQSSYVLQLSKELGLGQPLVAKHMALMEAAGLVTPTTESSPSGPRRKRYSLAKSVSITMDLAPNLFLEKGLTFGAGAPRAGASKASEQLRRRVEASEGRDDKEAFSTLSAVLREVDAMMARMDEERAGLLSIRDRAMREASRIAGGVDEQDKRRVLFYILDRHDREVERISESLNLRELSVRKILEELEKDLIE